MKLLSSTEENVVAISPRRLRLFDKLGRWLSDFNEACGQLYRACVRCVPLRKPQEPAPSGPVRRMKANMAVDWQFAGCRVEHDWTQQCDFGPACQPVDAPALEPLNPTEVQAKARGILERAEAERWPAPVSRGRRQEPEIDREPYFLEIATPGCATCQHDRQWDVIGPDGSARGQTWGDVEAAQDVADYMNEAFQCGLDNRELKPISAERLTAVLQLASEESGSRNYQALASAVLREIGCEVEEARDGK